MKISFLSLHEKSIVRVYGSCQDRVTVPPNYAVTHLRPTFTLEILYEPFFSKVLKYKQISDLLKNDSCMNQNTVDTIRDHCIFTYSTCVKKGFSPV